MLTHKRLSVAFDGLLSKTVSLLRARRVILSISVTTRRGFFFLPSFSSTLFWKDSSTEGRRGFCCCSCPLSPLLAPSAATVRW